MADGVGPGDGRRGGLRHAPAGGGDLRPVHGLRYAAAEFGRGEHEQRTGVGDHGGEPVVGVDRVEGDDGRARLEDGEGAEDVVGARG